uniref:hypothetical protein n=1 Tax=Arthrobacter sp. 68b TaxID=311808 RepID=UPI00156476D6|nr:hypothetical protein [Arthrobacter sp. 68b]
MHNSSLACVLDQGAQWLIDCNLNVPASPSPSPWDFGWLHITALFAVVSTLLTLRQKFRADRATQLWNRIEWSLEMAKGGGPERTLALIHVSGLLEPRRSRIPVVNWLRRRLAMNQFKYRLDPIDVETLRQAGLTYQGEDDARINADIDSFDEGFSPVTKVNND